MNVLLAMAMLAVAAPQSAGTQNTDRDRADGANAGMMDGVNGQWQIVEIQRDGKRVNIGGNSTATFRNGTFTMMLNGREQTWRVQTMGRHMVRVTPENSGNAGGTGNQGTNAPGTRGTGSAGSGAPNTGGTSGASGAPSNTGRSGAAGGNTGNATGNAAGNAGDLAHEPMTGIFIATNDFLCVALNPGAGSMGGMEGDRTGGTRGAGAGSGTRGTGGTGPGTAGGGAQGTGSGNRNPGTDRNNAAGTGADNTGGAGRDGGNAGAMNRDAVVIVLRKSGAGAGNTGTGGER